MGFRWELGKWVSFFEIRKNQILEPSFRDFEKITTINFDDFGPIL